MMRPLTSGLRTCQLLLGLCLAGCYESSSSNGGGQLPGTANPARLTRQVKAEDIALPAGYRIEAVATGLNFPTAVAFDDQGRVHVLEAGYSYGEVFTVPRLLRVNGDGSRTEITRGERPPWNGLDYHAGTFYIAEGGEVGGGRILRVGADGRQSALIENLPSLGDHHTNRPVVHEGFLYFGQGTATNSGVVGPDNADYGWLTRHRDFHDIPCRDITLLGKNFESENPLTPAADRVSTGAYSPFGTPSQPGQVIKGQLPCSGAVLRQPLSGGPLELVAWGFRNPFGLAFAPDGRLYVAENSYDARGSRPVFGTGDPLWRIDPAQSAQQPAQWYGWPDYHGQRPLSDADHFKEPGKPEPGQLLSSHPNPPPAPVAMLGVHSSSNGLDFSRSARFGHQGEAFVAQFGDLAPAAGKVLSPVGFKVVRVNVASGLIEDFAVNRGQSYGPASKTGGGGLERPLDARFDPSGEALYIVDFGIMAMRDQGPAPQQNTGVLWRIRRTE